MVNSEVDKWVEECDVDGRGISFEFFDSDIEDLKNAIKRDFDKKISELKRKLPQFIENNFKGDEVQKLVIFGKIAKFIEE